METAGLSLLFGMLLGDFTGGGAGIIAARKGLQTAYSRAAGAAAGEFGANPMYKAGGGPPALGGIPFRISGAPAPPRVHLLLRPPQAQDGADAIARIAQPSPMRALLTPVEWRALKNICAGG